MILTIVGARPNFIKAAMVSRELERQKIEEFVIHTGQHYDFELSQQIFGDLKIRPPDVNLGVGSGLQGEQTARMLTGIEKILVRVKPKAVIVYGDTNSTLAGALAAAKLKIPIVHVEAGERSGDRKSPEEINRIICDHLAAVNCCVTKKAVENLGKEGIGKTAVRTGDVMLDLLLKYRKTSEGRNILRKEERYYLLTLHRAENVDDQVRLKKIITVLAKIPYRLIWPIHPRTEKMMSRYKIKLPVNIKAIRPAVYTQMLELIAKSERVITDSGGVQKEAYWLGIPCVTLLQKTSWTETLGGRWNQTVFEPLDRLPALLSVSPVGRPNIRQFGRGDAAKRIVDAMK